MWNVGYHPAAGPHSLLWSPIPAILSLAYLWPCASHGHFVLESPHSGRHVQGQITLAQLVMLQHHSICLRKTQPLFPLSSGGVGCANRSLWLLIFKLAQQEQGQAPVSVAQILGRGKEQRFRGWLLPLQEGESILIVFPKRGGGEQTRGPLLSFWVQLSSLSAWTPLMFRQMMSNKWGSQGHFWALSKSMGGLASSIVFSFGPQPEFQTGKFPWNSLLKWVNFSPFTQRTAALSEVRWLARSSCLAWGEPKIYTFDSKTRLFLSQSLF